MRKSLSLVLSAAVALCVTAGAVGVAGTQVPQRLTSQEKPSMLKASTQNKGIKAPKVNAAKAKTVAKKSPFSYRNTEARVAAPKHAPKGILPAEAGVDDLTGFVIFATNWSDDNQPAGLYNITSEPELIALMDGGNGYYNDGSQIYTVNFFSFWGMVFVTYYTYDAETYELIESNNSGELQMVASDIAVNPVDGLTYGCFFSADGSSFEWGVADYPSWSRSTINSCPEQMLGVAIDRQGNGYTIGGSGMLYSVDVQTGEFTEIGHTGLEPHYLSSAAIDGKSGKMYFSYSPEDESGWLYEIDTNTAEATPVWQFVYDDEVTMMSFPLVTCDDKAPAAPTFEVTTDKGDLTAKWTLTAPTTLFDGTEATGDLTYVVNANGNTIDEGTVAYGASVEGTYTAETSGKVSFTAQLTGADELAGPVTKTNAFIGFGVPTAPAAAAMAYDKDTRKVTLTWDVVTTSSDGGYMDPAAVTYDVYDWNGNEIAKNLKKTTINFTLPVIKSLTRYQYYVVAKSEGLESDKTYTDYVILGEATPPYVVDFEDANDLDYFTIIDNNADGKVWTIAETDGNKYAKLAYNGNVASDDYIVSSPIKLKAGEVYPISMDIWGGSSTYVPEKFEVLYGTAPTVEALTNVLVAPTELYDNTVRNYCSYLTAPEDMVIYVAVHGISDADMLSLNFDNFKVGAGLSQQAPSEVTDIVLGRDPRGELKVDVKAKIPTVDFAGNPVAPVKRVDVFRDGELLKSVTRFDNGSFTVEDATVPTTGVHTYAFVPYNEYGEGKTVSKSVYVGFAKPGVVTDVKIERTATPGEVHVSWAAPATDVEGNPIPADLLQYNVYDVVDNNLVLLDEAMTETEFTKMAVEEGQDFVYYFIAAQITDENIGAQVATDMIAVGEPYLAPWKFGFDTESFNAYIMGMNSAGGAEWGVYDNATLGMDGASGPGDAFAGCKGNALGAYGDLFTGIISCENLQSPRISFYTYKVAEDDDNTIDVFVTCDGVTEQVLAYSQVDNDVLDGWKKLDVNIFDYAGKTIQITFRGMCQSKYAFTLLDNISVTEALDNDLSVGRLIAPETAEVGKEFTVYATVSNEGAKTADNFSVTFYRNGEVEATYTDLSLAANETETYELQQTLSIMSDSQNEYTVQVDFAADENNDNNVSDPVTVNLIESTLNGVTDLEGVEENGGFKLTWTAPDPSTFTPDAVVEGFEDMDDNAPVLDPWTSIDVDGKAVGGILGITWDLQESPQGFFVIDGVDGQLAAANNMIAHSGNKFAASCFLIDGSNCDDWLVSPELYGGPQTISFYANSFNGSYPEQIEVLCSTGGKEVEDFTPVTEPVMVPCGAANGEVTYTQYTAVLPDGAKYFAIRSFGTNAFYLMVDDVEYIPAGASSSLVIEGYNVYRDGEKLNDKPLTETEYFDSEDLTAQYCVTVVFNKGESRRSNIVSHQSGIADLTVGGAKVAVEGHNIVVTGAKDMEVAIFTTDGKVISRATGDARVNVAPAVYVVKVGKKTTKVVVR